MKQGTAKVRCACKHEFQDRTHGPGIRVANTLKLPQGTQKPSTLQVRCTVCSHVHSVPVGDVS